jgi:hypothetical protein
MNGQVNLLPVPIIALMKGAMANMDKIGKLALLAVLGLATASPIGLWLVRQGSGGPSDTPIAESAPAGPTLQSALHLDVTLPPGTPITANPSVSVSFSN